MTELRVVTGSADALAPVTASRRRLQRARLYLRTAEIECRARLPLLSGTAHACTLEVADRIGAALGILEGMQRDESSAP